MRRETQALSISKRAEKLVKTNTNLIIDEEKENGPWTLKEWSNPNRKMLESISYTNADKYHAKGSATGSTFSNGIYKRRRVIRYLSKQNIDVVRRLRKRDDNSICVIVMQVFEQYSFGVLHKIGNLTKLISQRLMKETLSKTSIDGNDNIFEDEINYTNGKCHWDYIQNHLVGFESYVRSIFGKIYYHILKHSDVRINFNVKFSHLELYTMVKTHSPSQDLNIFEKKIRDEFGVPRSEKDSRGNIVGPIIYHFNTKDYIGSYIKVYRKTEDLIKVEIVYSDRHFSYHKNKQYKNEGLGYVLEQLRLKTERVLRRILVNRSLNQESLTYEECIEDFIPHGGKHFKKLIQKLTSNAGSITIKSKERGYRNVLNLVNKGILTKGGVRSTFELNPKYSALITRNFNYGGQK
ncbi:hypothetical protein M902_2336 [Bacteriovorax sp. BAL6_X]|uniref:hypothetical protein n=1 Tax=Bacteriovorax sp. BAL6_X TaxID=1201290 RepID=UPI0003856FBF|nr:hypothetical protein [Bacteriovorax sp. BAL6_X]EPZ52178.1 hypothetical protein M902_2336 [Bacteriovorax sp. BAL6_X]